ncbi:hypothetical protein [Terrimonas ferruginea]|uniref:hypothetical protein n=1 Tax=Terrimonas ferruginea TaxID=249 RepID=UPI0004155815|nr:hypothetical protein [Terrimonas ferruginea]
MHLFSHILKQRFRKKTGQCSGDWIARDCKGITLYARRTPTATVALYVEIRATCTFFFSLATGTAQTTAGFENRTSVTGTPTSRLVSRRSAQGILIHTANMISVIRINICADRFII